jgi:dienelactone hydrolase
VLLLRAGPARSDALDPEVAFGYPRAPIVAKVLDLPPAGALRQLEVRFDSALPSGYLRNDRVHAKLLLPASDAPAPCVIVLHPLRSKNDRLIRPLAVRLAEGGVAALLVTLPYHMERTPEGSKSGRMMITGDPAQIVLAFRQAIVDLRCAVDWLQTRAEIDPERLGVTGVSLGGILALLLSQVDTRIRAAVPILGSGEFADIFSRSPITMPEYRRARRSGWTPERLREAFRPIDPVSYAGCNPGCRVVMINAAHDVIVPRGCVERTWQALGQPQIVWLNASHYSALIPRGEVFRLATDVFRGEFGLAPPKPIPAGIPSTTLRVGLIGDRRGLQFGVVLEGLNPDATSPFCADLALSTKGVLVGASVRLREWANVGVAVPVGKRIRGVTPYLTVHANL